MILLVLDKCPKYIADMRLRILSPNVQICPQYGDFSFTDWDLNSEVCLYMLFSDPLNWLLIYNGRPAVCGLNEFHLFAFCDI